ncbi:O-antigen ligase family protein [Mesorhizobium caraganae]|uniref:O-antigen ligase family protein n=1 Tax=Mesorhizobium caraganae TaxID=483206 RepID=A0ABV1Z1S0_9HYPH
MSDEEQVPFNEFPEEAKRILTSTENFRLIVNEIQTRTKEKTEYLVSGSRALLVAHGAGLVTGVQILSQNSNDNITGIGKICAIFCVGFLCAMTANFFAFYALEEASARYWEKEENNSFRTYLWCAGLPLVASIVILFMTVMHIGATLSSM